MIPFNSKRDEVEQIGSEERMLRFRNYTPHSKEIEAESIDVMNIPEIDGLAQETRVAVEKKRQEDANEV